MDKLKCLDTPIQSVAIANARAYIDAVAAAVVTDKWDKIDTVRRFVAAARADGRSESGIVSTLRQASRK